MVTYAVTYTHADATTLVFKSISRVFGLPMPGKSIERQPNKIGKIVDPNQGFRELKIGCFMDTADLLTLYGMLQPAAIPTYDGTDPKVAVKLNGDETWTFLCAILGRPEIASTGDDKWFVTITFTERSA